MFSALENLIVEVRFKLDREPLLNRRGKPRTRGQKFSPVIHVLLPTGECETFKQAVIALPDDEDAVYAVLVNRHGEPYVDPTTHNPVVFPAPPILFAVKEDDDTLLTWEQVAQRAGVSVSTVKRAVKDGVLPKPTKVTEQGRAVRFPLGNVRPWLTKVTRAPG